MKKNPLKRLASLGQSLWLDYISRDLIESGKLKRMIVEDGLRGMTSNPAIFEKAIVNGKEYSSSIQALARAGRSAMEIYETLCLKDVQSAADEFRPLYRRTGGADGYVSLEVNPHLARDTRGTVKEARRLWRKLDRPNVMIKVPATAEGLPAIERLIGEGINVNVTLLFSLSRYREVARAYCAGLGARLKRREPVDRVASVASFFLSRIDVLVDPLLENVMRQGPAQAALARKAHGQTAVASAKGAYLIYQEIFEGELFGPARKKRARPQRLLWASTGTKNPRYSDVKYVEALVGPHTVNTAPPETIEAYRDHGDPKDRLEEGVARAEAVLDSLSKLGIKLDWATKLLEKEGIEKFEKPFDTLLQTLEKERAAALKIEPQVRVPKTRRDPKARRSGRRRGRKQRQGSGLGTKVPAQDSFRSPDDGEPHGSRRQERDPGLEVRSRLDRLSRAGSGGASDPRALQYRRRLEGVRLRAGLRLPGEGDQRRRDAGARRLPPGTHAVSRAGHGLGLGADRGRTDRGDGIGSSTLQARKNVRGFSGRARPQESRPEKMDPPRPQDRPEAESRARSRRSGLGRRQRQEAQGSSRGHAPRRQREGVRRRLSPVALSARPAALLDAAQIPATLSQAGAGRFWLAVLGTGIGAGAGAAVLTRLLEMVQHFVWSGSGTHILDAAAHAGAGRRILALLGAGVVVGIGQIVLKRLSTGNGIDITSAIWFSAGRLPAVRTLGSAVLSVVVVGMGASLGREGAPKQAGAVAADLLADKARLSDEQRRLLVACGAGAGMAAAYGVPLGGALFALEVLRGMLALRLLLPALLASLIATAIAWLVLPDAPTYSLPAFSYSARALGWALVVGPVAGLVAVAYVRTVAWAVRETPEGWRRVAAPVLALGLLGLVAARFPQLLGNGRDLSQLLFTGSIASGPLLLALLALKPAATVLCVGSGTPGGLFTPSLTLGALLGGALGCAGARLGSGVPLGLSAVLGAGAVLAATTQGPISTVVLMMELTGRDRSFMAPLLLAVVAATVVSRTIEARSIYDARLSDEEVRARLAAREPSPH